MTTTTTTTTSTLKLLSIVLALIPSFSMGYSTSSGRPYVRSFVLEDSATIQRPITSTTISGRGTTTVGTTTTRTEGTRATTTENGTMQQTTRTNKKYDLGIGKHPPLYYHHHPDHGHESAVGEPSFSSLPFHDGYYHHHHPETALLVEDKKKDHQQHDDDGSVTQYMVEYDATREFPSPLLPLVVRDTRTTTGSSSDDSSNNKTKRLEKHDLPKVQPTRRTWDALTIIENNVSKSTKDHHHRYYHHDQDDKTVATRRKKDTFLKNNNQLHSTDDTTNHVSTIGATPETIPFIIRGTSTEKLDPNTIWVEMMLHSELMKTLVLAPQAS